MPRCRQLSPAVTLIRPLLAVRRTAVLDYLKSIDQPFCEDATNADLSLTRNAIRHELLPHLQQRYNPDVVAALVRLGTLAGQSQAIIDQWAGRLIDAAVTVGSDGTLTVARKPLEGQPCHLVRSVLMTAWKNRKWPLQAMGFAQWETLADMLSDPSPAPRVRTFPAGIRVERSAEGLLFEPTRTVSP
jgi:tRNA(Ile)-lysidine synthase